MAADVRYIKTQIDISAAKANTELNKLANKLDKILASISEINSKGLKGFTDDVVKLGQAMQTLGKIKITNFTHFADGIQQLSGLDLSDVGELASALTGIENVSENVNGITEAFGGLESGLAGLNGIWDAVTRLSELGNTLDNTKKGLEKLFEAKWIPSTISDSIGNFFTPFIEDIKEFISYISLGAGTISESFTAIFGVSITSVMAIVAAIAAVTLAIIDLWNTSEQFRDAVNLAFSIVKDSLTEAFQEIGEAVAPLWESIKELGAALYDFYESSGLKNLVEALASFAVVLVGIAGSAIIEIISGMITGLSGALQGIVDVLTGLVKVITGIFTFDGEKLLEGMLLVGEGVVEIIMGIGEAILGGLSDLQEKIFAWWSDKVLAFLDGIPEEFKELVNNIVEALVELPGKMIEIGKNIISGLWEGINGEQGTLKQGVGDVCLGLVNGFRENLDIHSPSRVLAEIGSYAILGLAEPFTDSGIIMEQIFVFTETLMNIFREQLSPENFILIAETAILAFMEAFQLGFENMNLVSAESMQLLSMSVVNTLTIMSQQITLILTTITAMMVQKWNIMLIQARLFWLQLNQLTQQNLTLLNTNMTVGMTAVNLGWAAKWGQYVATVRSACAEVQAAVSALNRSVQSMCSSMMSAIHVVKATASSIGSVSVHTRSVRGFASGGYPETGELFLARENGMNEMVGRIGSHSAVANNDQIVEAIRGAVMQGLEADGQNVLLREQNMLLRAILEKDTDISLDGRSLVDGIDRARKRMGRSFQFA